MLSDEGVHCQAYQFSSFCDFLSFLIIHPNRLFAIQIEDMKKHLERKVKAGKSKPKLKDIDADILPAAWSILRWSVHSLFVVLILLIVCLTGVSLPVRPTLRP